ncbi:hypothetical protein ACPZMI_04375 [Pseudomonas wayambapalatensis]|uniref:hypothetical protein n=1 Tax=Pseudomonas wayambapalatensis TaxID=485895 RepID=UPI003CF1173C
MLNKDPKSQVKTKQLSDLPEVLERFLTKKIESCAVVYLNREVANGREWTHIVNNYAFIVSHDEDKESDEVKCFFAERYGGDGILSNGGGGRCGFDGEWQLKGLGANHLVGCDLDSGHSDGNLALETAIHETIWAEIINAALPFGAIRTVAIMDTGLRFNADQKEIKRGLLVRLPAVRPAHFIRSLYYKQKKFSPIGEDAMRVKKAIHRVHEFLPIPTDPDGEQSILSLLNLGLSELVERYARQFAAARAKFIAHYNVSASNISLDGSWLDLSGTRFFTNEIKDDKLSIDNFENEYIPALRALLDICFYLGRYGVIASEDARQMHDVVIKKFFYDYNRFLNLYQVARTGIPFSLLLQLLGSPELELFSTKLQEILKFEKFSLVRIEYGNTWSGYEFCSSMVFGALYRAYALQEGFSELSSTGKDVELIEKLTLSYSELMGAAFRVAEGFGIDFESFMLSVKINVIRLNRISSVLIDLESLIKNLNVDTLNVLPMPCEQLTKHAVLAAKLNLNNEDSLLIPFWFSSRFNIWFNPTKSKFIFDGGSVSELSTKELLENSQRCDVISEALEFYGDARRELHGI